MHGYKRVDEIIQNKHVKMLIWMVVESWLSGGIFVLVEGHLVEILVVSLEVVELEWLMEDLPLVLVREFGVSW